MTESDEPVQGELGMIRVGDRLRMAREGAGLTLSDIAARTRITQRHLEAIEKSLYSELPGRTYVTGFARAYARAVDLPEAEIAGMIRKELVDEDYSGRPAYEAYEPADPARLPPRRMAWTMVIVALLLVSAYGVWRFLSVEPDEALTEAQNREATANDAARAPAPTAATAAALATDAKAAVVLTSTGSVWVGLDDDKGVTEAYRTLEPGQTWDISPDYVTRLQLRTSKAQALKITVGGRDIGPIGPADTLVKNISLKPTDLVTRFGAASASQPTPAGEAPR